MCDVEFVFVEEARNIMETTTTPPTSSFRGMCGSDGGGGIEPHPQPPGETRDFSEFMGTNRTGRRNAIPFLDLQQSLLAAAGFCSGEAAAASSNGSYYAAAGVAADDVAVNGLTQKLQQMDTTTNTTSSSPSFLQTSTTSAGYSANAQTNDKAKYEAYNGAGASQN